MTLLPRAASSHANVSIYLLSLLLPALGPPTCLDAQSVTANPRVEVVVVGGTPSQELVLSTPITRCTTFLSSVTIPTSCSNPAAIRSTIGATTLDVARELDLSRATSWRLSAALKLAEHHRVRFRRFGSEVDGDTRAVRPLVLGAQGIGTGIHVISARRWSAWRLGYQWTPLVSSWADLSLTSDVSRVGTHVDAQSPEFRGVQTLSYDRSITVPSVGLVGEVRPVRRVTIGVDAVIARLDRMRTDETFRDIDAFVTADIMSRLGFRVGYQYLRTDYAITEDREESSVLEDIGHMRMKGGYIGAAVRF